MPSKKPKKPNPTSVILSYAEERGLSVEDLLVDYQDARDARLVLHAMGHSRRDCKKCSRRTVTPGYICWKCGFDNSKTLDEEA